VEAVLTGKNGTIFAYGQTGSGKSYSMFGADGGIDLHPGIVPRCIHDIFLGLSVSSSNANANNYKSSVYVSFLQVYNEQVFDMFQSKGLMTPLDIREKDGDVVVVGLKQYYTQNLEQCLALIKVGLRNRTVRETSMNHASSRSHSILQIMIEQERDVFLDCGTDNTDRVRRHEKLCSKLNLCDLAGSERWGVAGMGDEQISELTNINSSLHTLGRCIAALAKQSQSHFHSRQDIGNGGRERVKFSPKKVHIPFRDSKLTRVLQDSLGGNTKTCLLATINPSVVCGDENICTLRFADRAHQVMTNATVNEKSFDLEHPEVAVLRHEIRRLNQLLVTNGIVDPAKEHVKEEKESIVSPQTFHPQQSTRLCSNRVYEHAVKETEELASNHCNKDEQIGEVTTKKILGENNCISSTAALDDLDEREMSPNTTMQDNHAFRRIIGMLGSILTSFDTFLSSISVSAGVQPSVEDEFQHQHLSSTRDRMINFGQKNADENNESTGYVVTNDSTPTPSPIHKYSYQDRKKHKTSCDEEIIISDLGMGRKDNTLNMLLNKRKMLTGKTERSFELPDDEGKMKRELAKAFKKRDQKLQLHNWLLEKEMKAENPFFQQGL
jgi:hypothetical protein